LLRWGAPIRVRWGPRGALDRLPGGAAGHRGGVEQDLGHGQADQLGVGEARRSAGALPDAQPDEEVVDFDVACRDEGVEVALHTSRLGALALLVTAHLLVVADSESFI